MGKNWFQKIFGLHTCEYDYDNLVTLKECPGIGLVARCKHPGCRCVDPVESTEKMRRSSEKLSQQVDHLLGKHLCSLGQLLTPTEKESPFFKIHFQQRSFVKVKELTVDDLRILSVVIDPASHEMVEDGTVGYAWTVLLERAIKINLPIF
jgi:aromatic ring-cleaving dioxygenase